MTVCDSVDQHASNGSHSCSAEIERRASSRSYQDIVRIGPTANQRAGVFLDFLSRRGKSSRIQEHEEAPLLANDVLASDYEEMQYGFDSLDGSSDLAGSVGAVKKSGRKARARAGDLSATRRGGAASAAGSAVKHGAMVAGDVLLPGAGTAAGAVDGAMAVRGKSKEGRSGGTQSAKQGAGFAAGFIPVVGPFLAFAEDIYGIGKETFQPSKTRTRGKVIAAERLMADARERLAQLPALRERLAEYEGPEKATFVGQLDKAESRLNQAISDARAWTQKKAERGTLPLLGDDGDF